MNTEPFDFASTFARTMSVLPNVLEDQQRRAQISESQAQTALIGAKIAADKQEQMKDVLYQQDLGEVLRNPSAANISALIMKHPERAEELKSSWNIRDKAARDADLTQIGEVYSAASSGKWKLAADLVRKRYEADKAAGQADESDEHMLEMLESEDPDERKAALALLGTHIAAVTGPEHFGTVYGALNKEDSYTLDAGAARFKDGKMVAHSPFLKGGDDTIYDWNSVLGEGGGQASGGGAGDAGSVQPKAAAVASTLSTELPAPVVAGFMGNFHVEGGWDGAKGDGGSAHGIGQWRNERVDNFKRVIGKMPTEASPEEQAKFVLWEMQHPEAAGMTPAQRDQIMAAKTPAQAAALIDQFYERSDGKGRPGRMAAADAFASTGFSGGNGSGPRVLLPGKKKEAPSGYRWNGENLEKIPGGPADGGEQYRILTPDEAQAQGLDPAVKFQVNTKTGQVTAIGGQTKAQLKPWPVPALKDWSLHKAAIGNIVPALKLLDPKNESPEAKRAKSAIGTGTGMLGDTFTQWNDPKGTPYRAMIGRIGGIIIKEQSGAAVSISEDQRLAKWVPLVSDRPEVAHAKLRNLVDALQNEQRSMEETYTEDQGFRPPPGQGGAAPVRVRSQQEAAKLPSGTLFVAPNGKTYRKK